MDNNRRKTNPKHNAGFFSRLLFWWLLPIFAEGKKHDIESKDLYEVLPENLCGPNSDYLEKNWKSELSNAAKEKRKPSLFRALGKTFKWRFLKYAIHAFVMHFICQTLQPMAVCLLILHFDENQSTSATVAYIFATIFIISRIVEQILFNHTNINLRSVGISARVACTSLIYRKILKLSYNVKQSAGGRIMTLLSSDVARLEIFFLFLHTLWVMPLQTLLVTYLIFGGVGAASLVGVCLLIALTVPVLGLSGRVMTGFRRKIAAKTDERLVLLGEIVRGIRTLKMYAWEKPFEKLVFLARRNEIGILARAAYLRSFLYSVMSFAQRAPLYITIIIYVIQGNPVTAYIMFTLVQYFNILHVLLGSLFLRAISLSSETVAAVRRIQEFLLLEEQVPSITYLPDENQEFIVSIKDVSVGSFEGKDTNCLDDIKIDVERKSLIAIVGPVGAGKVVCLLLKLILDELQPSKGRVYVFGKVSYASQEPWLFKGTLKSNILFGEIYDQERYDRVTKACALTEDFKQLSRGDETVVGESGATLSGGQCARVNLARAVYRNADIYLLDDPLSAVDSRVGKRLFDDCINGLLKDKTRILITHQLQFLKEAKEVILMDKGRVEYQGSFTDLQKTDELLQHLDLNDEQENKLPKDTELIDDTISLTMQTNNTITEMEDGKNEPEETERLLSLQEQIIKSKEKDNLQAKKDMLRRKSLYWQYFTACGSYFLPFTAFLAFVLAQLFCSGSDYFIAYWSKHQMVYLKNSNSSEIQNTKSNEYLDSQTVIYILAGFTIAIIVMSIVKNALCTTVLTKSNERLHNIMAASMIGTKMQFFENNDSGRILNRFSKDMGSVDERLQSMLHEAIEYGFIIVGVVTQIFIINKYSIIVISLMGFLFYKGRAIVIKTTRDIMRLEGQAKSPVFYHVNSSFAGRLTIRACKAQSTISKTFDELQDEHTAAASICQYSLMAYSCWLDCITLLFTALITYSFLLTRNENSSGADVGLAITQLLTLTAILSRGIKLTGDIETQMISVERLFQYTELEPEEIDDGSRRPVDNWPSGGKIEFNDLSMRYYQNDCPVLKNLTFVIEPGEKIGIVGRTGSGKSSLIYALFRLARIEGQILIDDLDTRKINLEHLRRNISILPQKPVLYPVSLRKNLDPSQEFDDASLWSALSEVELNNAFSSLDLMIDQGNLSSGQHQLLCLARVILKKNKIVILDEATANVDANTEALIQKTIADKFKECTVLTIAHRLNTVKDMDKIIVMDQGRVVEYDRPEVLIQRTDGYFSKMLSQYMSNNSS